MCKKQTTIICEWESEGETEKKKERERQNDCESASSIFIIKPPLTIRNEWKTDKLETTWGKVWEADKDDDREIEGNFKPHTQYVCNYNYWFRFVFLVVVFDFETPASWLNVCAIDRTFIGSIEVKLCTPLPLVIHHYIKVLLFAVTIIKNLFKLMRNIRKHTHTNTDMREERAHTCTPAQPFV